MIIKEYNDITFKVGKTAEENWQLISEAGQNHWWFHLDNLPSPHVIICDDLKDKESSETIDLYKYASQLCRENSKYKNSSANVIYTQINNIKKGEKVGSVYFKSNRKCLKMKC